MNQSLVIAGATYRLLSGVLISTLAVMTLPLLMSLALTVVDQGQKGLFHEVVSLAQSVMKIVYVAALLRIFLLGVPATPRALHFGRVELIFVGYVAAFVVFSYIISSVYFGFVMAPVMMLMLVLGISLSHGIGFIAIMGGYVVVFVYVILRLITLGPTIILGGNTFVDTVAQAWGQSRNNTISIAVGAMMTVGPIAAIGMFGVATITSRIFEHSNLASDLGWVVMNFVALTVATCLSGVVFRYLEKPVKSG